MVPPARVVAVVAVPVLFGALSACGGSGSDSAVEPTAAPTTVTSTPPLATGEVTPPPGSVSPASDVDPCSVLTANEVLAVLGYSASDPQPVSIPGDAYALSGCTWGGPDQGVYLTLQAFTPGAIEDPLASLLGASGETPTPVSEVPGGELWNLGFLPGGGGQGVTVTWEEDGQQFALSLLGTDISNDQQQALITAAEQAAGALG